MGKCKPTPEQSTNGIMPYNVMSPCKDCSGRDELCHCYCLWYKEYREILNRVKKEYIGDRDNIIQLYRQEYWDTKKKAWRKK